MELQQLLVGGLVVAGFVLAFGGTIYLSRTRPRTDPPVDAADPPTPDA